MFGDSQFVFNLGGGPGFRVHQFGGGQPRRRPRGANGGQDEPPQSPLAYLINLLPVLILFVLPLLTSLFSGDESAPRGPEIRWSPDPPYTTHRQTPTYHFDYYVNQHDIEEYTPKMLKKFGTGVERRYLTNLQLECQGERQMRTRLLNQAQGIFWHDTDKLREANRLELRSCQRLRSLGVPIENY